MPEFLLRCDYGQGGFSYRVNAPGEEELKMVVGNAIEIWPNYEEDIFLRSSYGIYQNGHSWEKIPRLSFEEVKNRFNNKTISTNGDT